MPQERIFFDTYEVVGPVEDDAETVIAVLEGVVQRYANTNIALSGWAAVIPDSDVTEMILRIRRGDIDGDPIGDVGGYAFEAGAFGAGHVDIEVQDTDTGQVIDATFVLTLQCTDAGGQSQCNNVKLEARVH